MSYMQYRFQPKSQLVVTNPQVNAHVLSSYHCNLQGKCAGRVLGVPGTFSIEGRLDRRAARGTACCRSDKRTATDRSLSHLLVTSLNVLGHAAHPELSELDDTIM